MNDFEKLDLIGVADGIRRRRFSARDIALWSIERLETLGVRYNAVFRIDGEAALARAGDLDDRQARGEPCGPLHGIPLAHKDLYGVRGRECHAGSLIFKGRIAERTAFALMGLDDAGQVNLGSLHMSEFALSPTGFNGHYGSGLNPWNPDYVSGGSSSGSGIAVAARLIFGSLGSDTGGSIRLPAAMCGVTGLKTTFRRISAEGCVPAAFSLDSFGPIAQSARDCARLLTHCSHPNAADGLSTSMAADDYETCLSGMLQGLRIGVPEQYFREDLDQEVASCLDASLATFKACGAAIVSARIPDMSRINSLASLVMSVEAAAVHRRWIESRPMDYSEQVRNRIEQGFAYSAVRYAEALSLRTPILAEFLGLAFAECDVLHVPVLPIVTPTIVATTQGTAQDILRVISRITHATRGINYLGLPAISVPAGLSKAGLPIAYQLIGRPFAEGVLLRAADAFQRETDWHRQIPALRM
ncbi:MAG TPA: amidase [Paralcaligenes sp.]|jgi:Asp-tRNAAsn/Glu-tRNAGln amidotransferase A subunit and related amidases